MYLITYFKYLYFSYLTTLQTNTHNNLGFSHVLPAVRALYLSTQNCAWFGIQISVICCNLPPDPLCLPLPQILATPLVIVFTSCSYSSSYASFMWLPARSTASSRSNYCSETAKQRRRHCILLIHWLPPELWRCWLGGRKGIRPVKKTEWWGASVVICLERGADLHTAQLMPLPLTVSCFSKILIGFTFLVPAHPGSPGQRAVKRVRVWFTN